MVPVTFNFNADEDAIDVGGVDFGNTKKWRDAQANPRVTFLLDDVLRDLAFPEASLELLRRLAHRPCELRKPRRAEHDEEDDEEYQ